VIRAVKLRIKETCKNANAPSHVRPFVLQILPHYCMGDRSGVCQHDVEAIDQREAFPKQEMADHCSENISHFRDNLIAMIFEKYYQKAVKMDYLGTIHLISQSTAH